jgi:hypothetical protein
MGNAGRSQLPRGGLPSAFLDALSVAAVAESKLFT